MSILDDLTYPSVGELNIHGIQSHGGCMRARERLNDNEYLHFELCQKYQRKSWESDDKSSSSYWDAESSTDGMGHFNLTFI